MSPAALAQAAQEATIFGRITPQQKEQLVAALHAHGHYVAMIGDGVNDVLSLKKADLGIAMQGGSQAARGVADIVLVNDSFAALAPAVLEGQRISNGMQAILKLYLARLSTMALVIVTALVVGIFPLDVRNGSVITLLTVGIPSILLALWAPPGSCSRASLRRDLWHFVVPAATFSSLLGLVVFYGTMALRLRSQGLLGQASDPRLDRAIDATTPYAQSALTMFLVFCGLFLVIFLEPPTRWWAGASPFRGERRPALLAVGLMLAYVVIASTPPLRTIAALSDLEPTDMPVILGSLLMWLLLVRLFWRGRLIERFLGLGQ
jgi:cation-transporting ATPase E